MNTQPRAATMNTAPKIDARASALLLRWKICIESEFHERGLLREAPEDRSCQVRQSQIDVMPHTKTRDYSSKARFVRTLSEKFARVVIPRKTTVGFFNVPISESLNFT